MNKLTEELETIIQDCLEIVRNQQQVFTSSDRYAIFEAFGSSTLLEGIEPALAEDEDEEGVGDRIIANLSFADHVLCWLANITVQHVLPIWEQYNFDNIPHLSEENNAVPPHFIWQIFENLLMQKIRRKDAFYLYHNYFHTGTDKFKNQINYNAQCVYGAAYKSIQILFYGYGGGDGYKDEEVDLPPFMDLGLNLKPYRRDEIKHGGEDFAAEAMLAYAAIDKNQAGDWQHIKGWVSLFTIKTIDRQANLQKIEISQDKRLEFWEWWLTEAIPQAWKLAQQSTQNKVSGPE